MTPKEKAQELIEKYDLALQNLSIYFEIRKHFTYNCALILVDEIIESLLEYDNRNNTYELQNMDRDFNYWKKVEQEIKKLKNAK
jgi:hypothetical protein